MISYLKTVITLTLPTQLGSVGKWNAVASRPTTGRLVRGLSDRLSVG